jgi:IS30 family transposase
VRHPLSTCNLSQVHDFIEIQVHLISQENPELKALYEQGHSIKEIAALMNFAYTSVHRQLVKQQVTFRANKSVKFLENQRQTFKNSAPPPYGFCYLDGRLQKDPREYPILQIIERQRQTGSTPTEIARYLDGRKFKTRNGKPWRQAHVFNIIQRLKITRSVN